MSVSRNGPGRYHMDELEYLMERFLAEASTEKFEDKSTNQDSIDCGKSLINDTVVTNTRFYVVGISVGVIASLGLLCNLISFIILASSMSKKIIFNKLLLMLTIFDILFLICGGFFMLHQALNFQNKIYNAVFPNIIYPMAGISMTGIIKKIIYFLEGKATNVDIDYFLLRSRYISNFSLLLLPNSKS